jgi:hypothetical protein
VKRAQQQSADALAPRRSVHEQLLQLRPMR